MGVKVLFKHWYVPTCVTLAKLMKLKTSERSKTSCVGFAELHEFSDLHVVCSVTLSESCVTECDIREHFDTNECPNIFVSKQARKPRATLV